MQEITPKQLWQSPNMVLTSHLREIGYYDEENDNYYVVAQFRVVPGWEVLNNRYLEIKAESKSHSDKIQKIIKDIGSFWDGRYDRTPTHFKMKFLRYYKILLTELGEKPEIKQIPGEYEQPGVNQYRLDMQRGIISLYPHSMKEQFKQLIALTPQKTSSEDSVAAEEFNDNFRKIFGNENYQNMDSGITQTLSGFLSAAVNGAFSACLPTLDEYPLDIVKKNTKYFLDFCLLSYIKCQKIFEYRVSDNNKITISLRSEEELRVHDFTLISATLYYELTERGFLLKKITTNSSDVFLTPQVSISKILKILILQTQHLIKSGKNLYEVLGVLKFLSSIFQNPPRNRFESGLQLRAKKITSAKQMFELLTEISKNQSKEAMAWLENLEASVRPLMKREQKLPLMLDLNLGEIDEINSNSFFSGHLSFSTSPELQKFWDISSSAEKTYLDQLSTELKFSSRHQKTVKAPMALQNKNVFLNRFFLTFKGDKYLSTSRIECLSLFDLLGIMEELHLPKNTLELFSRLKTLELGIKSKVLTFFKPLLNSLKNNQANFEITIAKMKNGLTVGFENSKPVRLIFSFSVILLMDKEKILTLDEVELELILTNENNFATKSFKSAENLGPYTVDTLSSKKILYFFNKLNAQVDARTRAESKPEKSTPEQLFLQVNLLEPRSDQLSTLVTDSKRLSQVLERSSAFINKSDEEGQTILHHVAKLGKSSAQFYKGIFSILLGRQDLDFNVQDLNGCSPLHVAFSRAESGEISQYIIAALLAEADKRKANFELLDKQGRSIYHYAALTTFNISTLSLIDLINAHVSKPNWNHLSESGATPFYYALTKYSKNLDAIQKLLSLGANPLFYGSVDRNPVVFIKKAFELLVAQAKDAVSKKKKNNLIQYHQNLVKLVHLVEEHMEVSGIAEATIRELSFPKVLETEDLFDFFSPAAPPPLEMKGPRSMGKVAEILILTDTDKPEVQNPIKGSFG